MTEYRQSFEAVKSSVESKYRTGLLDRRVLFVMLCCIIAGGISAVRLDIFIAFECDGSVLLPIAVAILKYSVAVSLCYVCVKRRLMLIILFFYIICCTTVLSFFTCVLVREHAAMLVTTAIPCIIYLYFLLFCTSFVIASPKEKMNFDKDGAIINKGTEFLRSCLKQFPLVLLGILVEGVAAPLIIHGLK